MTDYCNLAYSMKWQSLKCTMQSKWKNNIGIVSKDPLEIPVSHSQQKLKRDEYLDDSDQHKFFGTTSNFDILQN